MQGSVCLLDLVQLGLLCGEIANLLFFFLPLAIEKQSLLSLLLFFRECPLGIVLVSCSSCTTLLEGSRPNLRVVASLLPVFLIILEVHFLRVFLVLLPSVDALIAALSSIHHPNSVQSSSCQHVFYFRLGSEVYFLKWLSSYKDLSANLNSCGVTGGTPRARYAVTKAEPKSNCLSTWALPGGPPTLLCWS